MAEFVVGGPERYAHQKRAVNKMIKTGGVTALLLDPGLGKTACVLDYASLLAIKSLRREARVLVVCPLVAVDTWVLQASTFMSPQVNYWAEALGAGLLERAEALAARGEQPYTKPLGEPPRPSWLPFEVVDKDRGIYRAVCYRCVEDEEDPESHPELTAKRSACVAWGVKHMREQHKDWVPFARRPNLHPRALHAQYSWQVGWRADGRERPMTFGEGPNGLGTDRPRVVLEVLNLDTFVSRDAVGSQTMADIMLDAIRRFDPDLVVVDESHRIKASNGNASRLMARVAKFVKRRVILTGTVMPASPLDIFGQWRFLDPYAFGDPQPDGSTRQATFNGFKSRYAVFGGWMGKEVLGYRNLDEMQRIMARNAIVVRKKDALDLPPTTEVVIPVELSPAESKAYVEMKDALATLLGSEVASVPNRLSQMLRLRQITSGHLPDDTGKVHTIGTSKARTIASLVHDTLVGEKRIVIFALFTHEIMLLEKVLARSGTEIMTITGATHVDERLRMRQRFGSDDPQRIVMVAQIKTMSLAVNELVTANHAIFASLSQQRDDLVQARDRLDRIGQTRPVTFWYALAPGTVDEVILKSHRERTSLEDAMLRHIQAGGVLRPQAGDALTNTALRDALGMFGA